ncbi:hypothetical protein AGLY_003682 [Aphis glycines]|uniref:Uncharacterized protein n=1 Tax=Aphis glycines TaxID=307491 RepID=A0A6G0TZE6_APHGL|nr:hypothetical protein AGLY_003682 [Aphis glycines]
MDKILELQSEIYIKMYSINSRGANEKHLRRYSNFLVIIFQEGLHFGGRLPNDFSPAAAKPLIVSPSPENANPYNRREKQKDGYVVSSIKAYSVPIFPYDTQCQSLIRMTHDYLFASDNGYYNPDRACVEMFFRLDFMLIVTQWGNGPRSFLKKYGPMIPEEDKTHQTVTLKERCCAVQRFMMIKRLFMTDITVTEKGIN